MGGVKKKSPSLQKASHGFPPFVHPDSTILLLGSFPSVKSREEGFFYAHPQNRFWRLLADIYHEEKPESIAAKKALLTRHHLALYDVVESCFIASSSDASIRKVVYADIPRLLAGTQIHKILLNGTKASALYEARWSLDLPTVSLFSSSSANAGKSYGELLEQWSRALRPSL
jgi:TDG/mug DNA glycosylase family protein